MNTRNHANTDTFSFWHTSLLAELTGHAQFECGDFNRSSIWLENVPKPVCNLNCPDPSNVPFGFIYIMLLGSLSSSSKIQYDQYDPMFGDVFEDSQGCSTYVRPSKKKDCSFACQLVELFVSAKAWRIHERWGSSAETRKISKFSQISGSQTSVHQSSEIFDSNSAKADNWMCAPGYAGTVTFYCAFGPNCTLINEPAGSSVILALFCNFWNFFRFIFHPFIKNIKTSKAFLAFFSCLFLSVFILTFYTKLCTSALHLAGCLPFAPCNGLITTSAIDNCSLETILCDGIGPGVSCNVHCKPPYVGPPGGCNEMVKENTMRNSRNVNHCGIVECEW